MLTGGFHGFEGDADDPRWYCVRAKTKREHLAEQFLRQHLGVPAFAPRIRFRRATRRGMVWFAEGLFPGYLFAYFSLARQGRMVLATTGVSGLVHFGAHVPCLPDRVVLELQDAMNAEGVAIVEDPVREGDAVAVMSGPLMGLVGIVKRYLPATRRVCLLLEFMGRLTDVEVEDTRLSAVERHLVGPLLIPAGA